MMFIVQHMLCFGMDIALGRLVAGCSSRCYHQVGVWHFKKIRVSRQMVYVHTHLVVNTVDNNRLNNSIC